MSEVRNVLPDNLAGRRGKCKKCGAESVAPQVSPPTVAGTSPPLIGRHQSEDSEEVVDFAVDRGWVAKRVAFAVALLILVLGGGSLWLKSLPTALPSKPTSAALDEQVSQGKIPGVIGAGKEETPRRTAEGKERGGQVERPQEEPQAVARETGQPAAQATGQQPLTPKATTPKAEDPEAESLFHEGVKYKEGLGVSKDDTRALQCFTEAAMRGHGRAACGVAEMYSMGEGTQQDDMKAATWYEKSFALGWAHAGYMLALSYRQGLGVRRNVPFALNLLRDSANMGYPQAAYELGAMYHKGTGVARDAGQAAKWFEKGCEKSHAPSEYSLGIMYYKGDGIPADKEKAFRLMRAAAEQGELEALPVLARMYAGGDGTGRDPDKALFFSRKAGIARVALYWQDTQSIVHASLARFAEGSLQQMQYIQARSKEELKALETFASGLSLVRDDGQFRALLATARQVVASVDLVVENMKRLLDAAAANDETLAEDAYNRANGATDQWLTVFAKLDREAAALEKKWGLAEVETDTAKAPAPASGPAPVSAGSTKDGLQGQPNVDGVLGGKISFSQGVFPIHADKNKQEVQRGINEATPMRCPTCRGTGECVIKSSTPSGVASGTDTIGSMVSIKSMSESSTKVQCKECMGQGKVYDTWFPRRVANMIAQVAHAERNSDYPSMLADCSQRLSTLWGARRLAKDTGKWVSLTPLLASLWANERNNRASGQPVVLVAKTTAAATDGEWRIYKVSTTAETMNVAGEAILICPKDGPSVPQGAVLIGGLAVGKFSASSAQSGATNTLPVVLVVASVPQRPIGRDGEATPGYTRTKSGYILRIPKEQAVCPACKGERGYLDDAGWHICKICNGEGIYVSHLLPMP